MDCECHSDYNNGYTIMTDNCEHPAKFRISYYNVNAKKWEAKNVCGVHKRAWQTRCANLDRVMNENATKFTFTKLK